MSDPRIRINILLPCSRPKPGREWGDVFFGHSLSKALVACGADARLAYAPRPRSWPFNWPRRQVDLVVRGKKTHHAKPGRPFFLWVISNPETLNDAELSSAAHIFTASKWLVKNLQSRGYPASFLPQCTDPAIFAPEKARDDLKCPVLFVGNRRNEFPRPVVNSALTAGFPVRVWGRGWKNALPEGVFAGAQIPNEMLGAHYASASVVLNDHMEAMRMYGFASNRVYDVLASGSQLVSDCAAGIPEDLRAHVHTYEDKNDLPHAIARAMDHAHVDGSRAQVLAVAAKVHREHSFKMRAVQILEQIRFYQQTLKASRPRLGIASRGLARADR